MVMLGVNLANQKEKEAVPDGQYELEITGVPEKDEDIKTAKNGNHYFLLRLAIIDPPVERAKGITHCVWVPEPPSDNSDPKKMEQFENAKDQLKWLCDAFAIPYDNDNVEIDGKCIGNRGHALLGLGHSDEYGDVNNIKRFVTQ